MGVPVLAFARLLLRLPPTILVLLVLLFGVNLAVVGIVLGRFLIRQVGIDVRFTNREKRRRWLETLGIDEAKEKKVILGLFHPYCNAGGGGERVLWTAVAYHQREDPDLVCAVYSGDIEASKADIVARAKERFDIDVDPDSLLIIPLAKRRLVEDSTWPRFTLLGQSVGSIALGWEALTSLIPDVYLDTMGYAFTFPLFRHLGHCPVGAYVHYPTVSTDMIARVSQRQNGVTNSSFIATSWLLSHAKLLYYVIFLEMYSFSLRQADFVMVNSSWTKNHVDRLLRTWLYRDEVDDATPPTPTNPDAAFSDISAPHTAVAGDTTDEEPKVRQRKRRSSSRNSARPTPRPSPSFSSSNKPAFFSGSEAGPSKFPRSFIVYPPCSVSSFTLFPLLPRPTSPRIILSISQFRPEKAQEVQIQAVAGLLNEVCPEWKTGDRQVALVLAGSVRNDGDRQRVEALRALAHELDIENNVRFEVNVDWGRLRQLLSDAVVGINTMVDEHFGINVVEFMAAGLVPVVHASGGPRHDIVVPLRNLRTGFYASDVESFTHVLQEVLEMDDEDLAELRGRARRSAIERFGPESFETGWAAAWERLRKVERGDKLQVR